MSGALRAPWKAAGDPPRAIEPQEAVIDKYIPGWVRIISKIDDIFYAVKAQHVIDLTIALLLFLGLWYLM